jgi:hypothetical protein
VPYEPWIEVCSQIVEHAPQELIERHVKRHGGELSRLARNLPERIADLPAPQTSDPETERYLLYSAVAGLLREVAESVPVCLVLDDLHWADGQSVALLKHLVRTVEDGALYLIATYRDSDLGKDHPLTGVLADLRRVEGVQRISLHGLGVDEVAQLMPRSPAMSSNTTGLRWPGGSPARPTATRFSWGRSCADSRSPARWCSTRPVGAGVSIVPRRSRCPRACAR